MAYYNIYTLTFTIQFNLNYANYNQINLSNFENKIVTSRKI